jgi:hypothetical protein
MSGHFSPHNCQIMAKIIMNINNIARRWQLFGENNSKFFYLRRGNI